MKVLSLSNLQQFESLDSEQEELMTWSVLSAGNKISRKVIAKDFPHPNIMVVATILALYKRNKKMAENILVNRAKLKSHMFMINDPQGRLLKALANEHNLKIAFKECECDMNDSSPVCHHCNGLAKKSHVERNVIGKNRMKV